MGAYLKIIAEYQTGDSFHTEETSETLEYNWTNYDICLQNLERIKIHYEYYNKYSYQNRDDIPKKLPDGVIYNKEYDLIQLVLLDNEGNDSIIMTPPWCGYFETLYGVYIEGGRIYI